MTRPRRSLIPLPELVPGLIKAQGLEIRMMEYSLQQQWCAIVGSHIAAHTYPEAIRHRKLYLLAENSVWLQQLVFLKTELLAKIAESAGYEVLIDIVLRVGLIPSGACPHIESEAAPVDVPVLDSRRLASIDEALALMPHDMLTEQLRALFQKCAVAARSITPEQCVPQTGPGAAVFSPPVA
jgi:hypothetical protein